MDKSGQSCQVQCPIYSY